tara:strand:- start:175 stop:381 length:207 start_codon:yes stop_codon:yes gene_type:complete
MAENIDHQGHLKSLVEQQQTLASEIESKQRLLLKVTGAIEYLTELGVKLPEPTPEPTPETPSEPEVVD